MGWKPICQSNTKAFSNHSVFCLFLFVCLFVLYFGGLGIRFISWVDFNFSKQRPFLFTCCRKRRLIKHGKSKKTLSVCHTRAQPPRCRGIHLAAADHSAGQDAGGYCLSVTLENILLVSGPLLAACLETQSKVISCITTLLFCFGGKLFLIIC